MTRLAKGKGCPTHKVKYEDRHAARTAARNLVHLLGRMNPYRCRLCGWYHIGHPTKGKGSDERRDDDPGRGGGDPAT